MKSIFAQIKRFENVDFKEGEAFSFLLPKNTNTSELKPEISPVNNIANNLHSNSNKMEINGFYSITVKNYMTEPATSTFDFQDKWNNGIPMPLCIMQGKVIKETRGMYFMELQGKIGASVNCISCGRKLTNKISMLYGIGPECGKHFYINPFNTEEELEEHWQELKDKISQIKWSGWVIKSAIKEWKEVE